MTPALLRRLAIHGFVLIVVLLLDPNDVLQLFIVLGQAHFILTYRYQTDAGWYTPKLLVVYGITLISLFYLATTRQYDEYLVVVTATHFMIHYLFDEVKLFRRELDFSFILIVFPIFFTFSYLIVSDQLGVSLPSVELLLGVAVACYAPILLSRKLDWERVYFIAVFVAFVAASSFFWISTEKAFGYIILTHYLAWYVEYYVKINNAEQRKTYIWRVTYINVGVIALYGAYVWMNIGALGYVFMPIYFYVWTLLHTLFSMRKQDYKVFAFR